MSRKLTQRDFDKIKYLTKIGKSKYEISEQTGFTPKTIQHVRNVSSYEGYRKRYVDNRNKSNEVHFMRATEPKKAIPAPVLTDDKDPVISVPELKTKSRNPWKRIAITFMAIALTVLGGAIAVETLLIVYLWSNYVS